MTYLRDLGHDVGNRGRQVGSAAMAGHAILGHGIVRRAPAGVAGRNSRAGATASCDMWHDVQAFTPTVAYAPTWASGETWLVARLVDAARASCQRIDLSLHHAVRIVTRQTHLRVGTVAHQKVLRDLVDCPARADRGNSCTRCCR